MDTLQQSALPRPDHSAAECRASREPFDAAFRCINERRDISAAAKLVHAHLVSIHRIGRDETQTEIGEALGMSRHQVWRAVDELVAAGLVQTVRIGLGNPNHYVLLGLAEDDLNGRASARRPSTNMTAGQSRSPARANHYPKKNERNDRDTGVTTDYLATRDYGGTDYTMTRFGRLPGH